MRPDKVCNFFRNKGYEIDNKIVYRDERYTVARASLRRATEFGENGELVFKVKCTATGISRRSGLDKLNEEVGGNIAIARALDALYKKHTRQDHEVHRWYHG